MLAWKSETWHIQRLPGGGTSVISCCITNYPELRVLKQPLSFSHNFMDEEQWRAQLGGSSPMHRLDRRWDSWGCSEAAPGRGRLEAGLGGLVCLPA